MTTELAGSFRGLFARVCDRRIARAIAAIGAGIGFSASDQSATAQTSPAIVWRDAGLNALSDLDVSPDGALVATADAGSVKLFRGSDGKFLRALRGVTMPVTGVRFTPDGTRLIAGTGNADGFFYSNGMLHSWSIPGGEPLLRIDLGAELFLRAIRLTSDGAHVIGTQYPAADCACPYQIDSFGASSLASDGHDDVFHCLMLAMAVSPVAPAVVTACDDALRFYDVPINGMLRSIPESSVRALAYSPDGNTLAIGDAVGGIRTRRASDGELSRTFPTQSGAIGAVAYSPGGDVLATARGLITSLWNPGDGTLLRTLEGCGGVLRFFADGERLAAGALFAVKILNWRTGELQATIGGAHSSRIIKVAFARSAGVMASAGSYAGDGVVIWDWPSLRLARRIPREVGPPPAAMALSPDGTLVATTTNLWNFFSGAHVYRTSDGALVHELVLDNPRTGVLAFSPDGSKLAAAGSSNPGGRFVRVWNTKDGAEFRTIAVSGEIHSCVFSPGGSSIAVARNGSDGFGVQVWSLADGSLARSISTSGWQATLKFSPDGGMLAVSNSAGIRLFDLTNGQLIRTFTTDGGGSADVDFDPTGEIIIGVTSVISSTPNLDAVYLWRVADGVRLAKYDDEVVDPGTVAFSPGARLFAYGGGDATLVVARNPFAPCQADFNEDAILDSGDVFDFLSAFIDQQPLSDYNADGFIDSQDFFGMLTDFFAGCK